MRMTTPLASPRRTADPDAATSPGAFSASFDSPVSADWSTETDPVRSLTSAGITSPTRILTMSPGRSSREGITPHFESRRTRAPTCRRLLSASTTPAARCACVKLITALITRRAETTARSEYFRSTAESTMMSSSIQADTPQNSLRNLRRGMLPLGRHLVVPVLPAQALDVRPREPGVRVRMERGKRVRDRHAADVGGLRGPRGRRRCGGSHRRPGPFGATAPFESAS